MRIGIRVTGIAEGSSFFERIISSIEKACGTQNFKNISLVRNQPDNYPEISVDTEVDIVFIGLIGDIELANKPTFGVFMRTKEMTDFIARGDLIGHTTVKLLTNAKMIIGKRRVFERTGENLSYFESEKLEFPHAYVEATTKRDLSPIDFLLKYMQASIEYTDW